MPQLLQCVGSFQRIQDYCAYAGDSVEQDGFGESTDPATSSISLHTLAQVPARSESDEKHVITLQNNSFTWGESKTPFLKDIDLRVQRGSVTVCVGAVGSGKSMLLESMLGETICSLGSRLNCPSSVAYCAQQPWLENGTIQSIIIGVSEYDPKWYKVVNSACGLDADLQALEHGDKTIIGSKGLNLSGGQKQRIVSTLTQILKRSFATD
jgi:ATP-binding cassette subfamily C (CFTR/MRP) protein 1